MEPAPTKPHGWTWRSVARNVIAVVCAAAFVATGFTLTGTAYADENTGEPADTGNAPTTVEDDGDYDASSTGVAPDDVEWHDVFYGTNGSVSDLKIDAVVSGTAPFDNDDERGNDSSADNDIIRSYDTAVYDIDYALSPDPNTNGLVMDYYRSARVGFQFLIPADKTGDAYKLAYDMSAMGWVDTDGDYKAKQETVTVDGKDYLSLTAYRTLNGESDQDWVMPGNAMVRLVVDVQGAENGYQFAPIVRAWLDGDDDRTRMAETTGKTLTVSAALHLNGRIATLDVTDEQVFDFSTGNDEALNKDAGQVQGRQIVVRYGVGMRWDDRTKGMRGLELPTGPITYSLYLTATSRDEKDPSNEKATEEWYQPLFWQERNYQERTPTISTDTRAIARPLGRGETKLDSNMVLNTNDSVTQTRTADGTRIDITFDAYSTSHFPTHVSNMANGLAGGCSAVYMDDSCSELQVAELHAGYFSFVIPTVNSDGKSISEYYGANQSVKIEVSSGNMTGTSVTGDTLATPTGVTDNSNQSVTDDDYRKAAFDLRIPGGWEQNIRYSCGSEELVAGDTRNLTDVCVNDVTGDKSYLQWGQYSPNGVDGSWDKGVDHNRGSDQQQAGKRVDITAGTRVVLSNEQSAWPAAQMTLVKFNPDVLEYRYEDLGEDPSQPSPIEAVGAKWWGSGSHIKYADGTEVRKTSTNWLWGVKKDGTNWKSVDESKKASYDDLDFYDTYNEAKKHGVVLAAVWGMSQTYANDSLMGKGYTHTAFLRMKVKDNAPEGAIAVLTAESVEWTRADLASYTGLKANASDEAWTKALKSLGVKGMLSDLWGKVAYTNSEDGKNYVESTYLADGTYNGGDTAGYYTGDTLRVLGERVSGSKTIAQSGDNGAKNIYDLDRSERYADWTVTAHVESGKTKGTTEIYVTDTLPKGLTYVDGSSYVGGTYTENTPSMGTVEGGLSNEPTSVTVNADGTTTLEWTIRNVAYNKTYELHYSTLIGDQFDPNNDVNNGDQLLNVATFQSKGDHGLTVNGLGRYFKKSLTISKLRSAMLATRADQLVTELNSQVGFTSRFTNTSKTELDDQPIVHLMPANGASGTGSKFSGSYTVKSLTVSGSDDVDVDGLEFYVTDDPDVTQLIPENVTLDGVHTWTRSTIKNGVASIPSGMKVTAYAFVAPAINAGSSITTNVVLSPTGNVAGNTYVARWMDTRNAVDAISAVVSRSVDGYAFFDKDGNGIREDDDMLLSNVKVSIVGANDTTTVKDANGNPLTATTDKNGYWHIDGVPAGSGWRLYFQPSSNGGWNGLSTTLKEVETATDLTNSDADPITANGKLAAASVSLVDFPEVADMDSARFTVVNRNAGITGTPQGEASFVSQKNLTGRAFKSGESFTATITPVDNAPTGVLPDTITYKNGDKVTTTIDLAKFPAEGTYRYSIVENAGNAGGVTYDGQTRTIIIKVTDSFTDTIKRTATITVEGQSGSTNAITFTNSYQAAPTTFTPRLVKTVEDAQDTGYTLEAGAFEFRLVPKDGAPGETQTVANKADGSVTFNTLTFTTAGTYTYGLAENAGDRGGIAYDLSGHTLTVTVTDDGEGRLHASGKYDGKDTVPTIANQYSAKPATATPSGVKTVTPSTGNSYTMQGGEFTFTLTPVSAPNGATLGKPVAVANGKDGKVTFPEQSFTLPGDYTYTVTENTPDVPGVSGDGSVYTLTYTVEDRNHTGQLEVVGSTVTGTNGSDKVRFDNAYDPQAVAYTPHGVKTIENTDPATSRTPQTGEFEFRLEAVGATLTNGGTLDANDVPMPVAVGVDNVDNGFSFDPIEYTMPGKYTYRMTEVAGDDPTIAYDDSVIEFTVTVTDMGGKLAASSTLDETPAEFVNVYTPTPVDAQMMAVKTLDGRAMKDGEFTAILTGEDGEEIERVSVSNVEQGEETATGMIRSANGMFLFTPITYTTVGETVYTITEEQGDTPGVTYDGTAYTARVNVAENPETHALMAAVAYYDMDGAPIAPSMDTDDDAATTGSVDANAVAQWWTDNSPEGVIHTAKQLDNGTWLFAAQLDPATGGDTSWLHVFTADEVMAAYREANPDDADVETPESAPILPVFANTYRPQAATATLNAVKTLTGATLEDGMYTFTLTDKDGNVIEATNTADGTITFQPLEYAYDDTDPVGVYEYVMAEKAGDDKHVTYDGNEYKVLVTVTDNTDTGLLETSVEYQTDDGNQPEFANVYTPDVPMANTGAGIIPILCAGVFALAAGAVMLLGRNRRTTVYGRHRH